MHDLPVHSLSPVARLGQSIFRRCGTSALFASQYRYNLTTGRKPRFVWFRVAKVGTRSIFHALRAGGVEFGIENGVFLHYRPNSFAECCKFAFVRNPWERFLSCWHDRVVDRNHFGFSPEEHREMQDLSRFIAFVERLDTRRADVHLRPQSCLIDLDNIDFLGRMETFDSDWASVAARLGLKVSATPSQNVSSRPRGRLQMDPAQADRIGAIYERDVRIFGYSPP